MVKVYLIEHVNGGKWLSQHGFVSNRAMSLRFPLKQDAEGYLAETFPGSAHNVVEMQFNETTGHPGQAEVEYDPWGLSRGR